MPKIEQLLPTTVYQALIGGQLPSASNPFATVSQVVGGSDNNFVFTQVVPALSWVVNHMLGKRCSVQVIDNAFHQIGAEIIWNSDNQVTINFNNAISGHVYCN